MKTPKYEEKLSNYLYQKLTLVGLVVKGLCEFSPEPECPGIMVPQAAVGAPSGLEEP